MNEIISEPSGLDDKEVTEVLDLLGAGFEDGGIIREISFFDSDNMPVKIIYENSTGFENKTDVKSSVISDVRIEIEDII